MLIAVPVIDGKLSMHFGHCDEFAIVEVDEVKKIVVKTETRKAPAHEPGVLPKWLGEQGVNVVIAGGMGQRAQTLFQEAGVEVKIGVQGGTVEEIVMAFLEGQLETGANICDH